MPKLLTQLVTSNVSTIAASTGASGGGGGAPTLTEVLLCTGQGSTTNYSNLSYSTVTGDTSVGTFTQGVATVQGVDAFSTNSSVNIVTYEFLEAGIFAIEFNTYAAGYHNFSSMTLHPNNQAAPAESLNYFGVYAQYSRKPQFVLRTFAVGDVVKFFSGKESSDIPGFSRIRISKLT
tara:strand:- start:2342 stop:2872 length:531 start_codon:yes stop_codon:yes gene_type:complete